MPDPGFGVPLADGDDQHNLCTVKRMLKKYLQLRYHIDKWSSDPSEFASVLSAGFRTIQVPQPNRDFNEALANIRRHAYDDVLCLVQEHLDGQMTSTRAELGRLACHDLPSAMAMAAGYVTNQLRGRTPGVQLQQWVLEGSRLVGADLPRAVADVSSSTTVPLLKQDPRVD